MSSHACASGYTNNQIRNFRYVSTCEVCLTSFPSYCLALLHQCKQHSAMFCEYHHNNNLDASCPAIHMFEIHDVDLFHENDIVVDDYKKNVDRLFPKYDDYAIEYVKYLFFGDLETDIFLDGDDIIVYE